MSNTGTERLTIRKIEPEEIRKISEKNTTVRMDEYLMSLPKDMIMKLMADPTAVQELMNRLKATLEAEYLCVYGGLLDDKLISYVSLVQGITENAGEDESGLPEIQIEVLPEYHGMGYATEMLERVLHMAMEEFGYQQFRYVVNPSNTASIALVKKVGGVLQEPKNYAEEMLLKTYDIERI